MIVKIHKSGDRTVLAICDDDLLNKKFSEGDLQLDLTVDFYKGSHVDEHKLETLIKGSEIINAVGEKSIKFLKNNGLKSKVVVVDKIPHVQIILT